MLDVGDPEVRLALAYAPPGVQAAAEALFAFDFVLAQVLASSTQPAIGQMRLLWWHDAVAGLAERSLPGQPVLLALERHVLLCGMDPTAVARIVDGWEILIEAEELDAAAIDRFGRMRGGALFDLVARCLDLPDGDPVETAGRGWALADLSRHLSDPVAAAATRDQARALLDEACTMRWSRKGRALGALAHLARMDLDHPHRRRSGSPRRVARALWHRLSGR